MSNIFFRRKSIFHKYSVTQIALFVYRNKKFCLAQTSIEHEMKLVKCQSKYVHEQNLGLFHYL